MSILYLVFHNIYYVISNETTFAERRREWREKSILNWISDIYKHFLLFNEIPDKYYAFMLIEIFSGMTIIYT